MNTEQADDVGIVVIGRNEGERLRNCLQSVAVLRLLIVYVDSGSTDHSIAIAESIGAAVVELEQTQKFTAARARNAGWHCLQKLAPRLLFVQFVDGDCEVDEGWIDAALRSLREQPTLAAVCGRRRERFPGASVYNRLCDLEWDTAIGVVDACGGDAMYRHESIHAVGGFRDDMIAGEEPELCFRLRCNGGRIVRLDRDMTRHDAAMTSFGQWWKRAERAGHAFAEAVALTRQHSTGLWRQELLSIWVWAFTLPALAIASVWWTRGYSLLLFLSYFVLWIRIYIRGRRRWEARDARTYATYCIIAKFAQIVGAGRYFVHRLLSRPSHLIEYKATSPVVSSTS